MTKKMLCFLLTAALTLAMLSGCGNAETPKAESEPVVDEAAREDAAPDTSDGAKEESAAAGEMTNEEIKIQKVNAAETKGQEPVLDINEIYGLSPDGDLATLAGDLQLTDEDAAKIKEGNFKVAICMHMLNNDVNVTKTSLIKDMLESYGVQVIAVAYK